jgi:transposase
MKELPDLSELDSKGKDALIGELWAEIKKLREKIESKPKKSAKNSSLPPALGFFRKPEVRSCFRRKKSR